MLEASSCRLRPGVTEFLKLAHQHHIPVLIVSGGISDVIEMLLQWEECYHDNITIVSNRLKYDTDDVMMGAEKPFMTASSKLDVVKDHEYFKRVVRDNVLLLGDMLSDLKVGACVSCKETLSVGFCHHPDRDLNSYCDNYDLVLLGNPGFDVINQMFRQIVAE